MKKESKLYIDLLYGWLHEWARWRVCCFDWLLERVILTYRARVGSLGLYVLNVQFYKNCFFIYFFWRSCVLISQPRLRVGPGFCPPSQLHAWSTCIYIALNNLIAPCLFASSKAAIDLNNESFSTFHILLPWLRVRESTFQNPRTFLLVHLEFWAQLLEGRLALIQRKILIWVSFSFV